MKSEFDHSPISIQFTLMSEAGYSSYIIFHSPFVYRSQNIMP